MDLLLEFARALALAGTAVFVLTWLLAWWGLRRGLFNETGGVKALDLELKALRKVADGERTRANPLHEKWLKFGGGFYGVVALLTWLYAEAGEVFELIGDLATALQDFDFGVIIRFFVESLMNFVSAFAWPAFWMQRIDTPYPWLWFLAAWVGYWAGVRLAQTARARRTENNS